MTHDAPPTAPSPAGALSAPARFSQALYGLSLRSARGDGDARAQLARLRRTLGRRGVEPAAFREVGVFLRDVPPDERDAYLLVAALYALHAGRSDAPWKAAVGSSFGASCGVARGRSVSMDLRFSALLDAHPDSLPYRLRQAVALLAAADVGVRYDVLVEDLLDWDNPRRTVQRRWAEAYWTPRPTLSTPA